MAWTSRHVPVMLGWALSAMALPIHDAEAATVTVGSHQEILVDGQPFLPIMQWLQSSSRIAYQKDLGINTFVGNGGQGSSQDYLDECASQGVWGVLNPADMSVAGHGSLLGWIFGDEPDLESNQVEPADVLTQYQSIKAADADHITFLTLTGRFYSEMDPPAWMNGSRDRYYEYAEATDAVGFDLYPVYGWCRPDWLYMPGDAHAELVGEFAPGKATYQWIEAVRTSGQWCELSERGEDDGPYPEEIRNEVWQAIANGATAIGYFTHSWECPGYTQFCLTAEQEAELARTNGQLTSLTAEILSPVYGGQVSVVADGAAEIDWIAKQHGSQVVLFAVNTTQDSSQVSFTVEGMVLDGVVEVIDESRTLDGSGESFADDFDALGVHIYAVELADPPVPDGGVGGSGTGGSGATGGAGGAGGAGGPAAAPGAPSDDDDCGCATVGRARPALGALGLLLIAGLVLRRRRLREGAWA